MYLSSDVDDQDGYTVRRHPDSPGEYLGGETSRIVAAGRSLAKCR